MRILHIFNEIRYSGAEIMYATAAPLFAQNNIELFALSTGRILGDFEPEFIKQQIKVWHKPLPTVSKVVARFKYTRKIVQFVTQNDIDLIHIHRSDAKWLFAFIAKLAGVKSMYTVHNVFKNRVYTWPYAYMVRLSSRKILGLQYQTIGKSVYENELRYYKNPSIRINNWFDGMKFFPAVSSEEKNAFRKKIGIPLSHFVLISTGGCSLVKNHEAIIMAIAKLDNIEGITYLHLGSGYNEIEEKQLSIKLGIDKNVIFLGNSPHVREYLIASDVYVMTSKFEGLSIASIEAMACAIPSILFNSPGLRDLINENDNGLLIEPNFLSLYESLKWIKENSEKAKQMADNALIFVKNEFAMNKNVKKIISLYSKMLS